MLKPKSHRVLVLCGPRMQTWHTAATLIEGGVNVVGVCIADQHMGGLPIAYLKRIMGKEGIVQAGGLILGRLLYNVLNKRKDQASFNKLFNTQNIHQIIEAAPHTLHTKGQYHDSATKKWIESLAPDLIVAHTPYWVDKSIRDIPKVGIIGGHPGLTPNYRGSHSAFWAIYNGMPEDVGCSVFWLDSGVDTGPLIRQERIPIAPGDSYVSLGWKGMIRQAEILRDVILDFDKGIPIPKTPHNLIPEGSVYPPPTLIQYLKYRLKQNSVR